MSPNPDTLLAQFREAGDINRVEDGQTVTYKRVMLLSPGVWTDAGSETTVDYSSKGIRESAENFVDMAAVESEIPDWPRLNNEQRAEALADAGDTKSPPIVSSSTTAAGCMAISNCRVTAPKARRLSNSWTRYWRRPKTHRPTCRRSGRRSKSRPTA